MLSDVVWLLLVLMVVVLGVTDPQTPCRGRRSLGYLGSLVWTSEGFHVWKHVLVVRLVLALVTAVPMGTGIRFL